MLIQLGPSGEIVIFSQPPGGTSTGVSFTMFMGLPSSVMSPGIPPV